MLALYTAAVNALLSRSRIVGFASLKCQKLHAQYLNETKLIEIETVLYDHSYTVLLQSRRMLHASRRLCPFAARCLN